MGSTWRLPEIQDVACRGWRFGKASGSKTGDICVGGNEMSSDSVLRNGEMGIMYNLLGS